MLSTWFQGIPIFGSNGTGTPVLGFHLSFYDMALVNSTYDVLIVVDIEFHSWFASLFVVCIRSIPSKPWDFMPTT